MFSQVFTLKGTEGPGTFAEPYSLCPASSKETSNAKPHTSFFVSDITNHRIIKVERIDERTTTTTTTTSTHPKKQRHHHAEAAQWYCTVVSPQEKQLLYIPRGLVTIPHSHKKFGHIRQALSRDVLIVVDSGHNRIRALSIQSTQRPQHQKTAAQSLHPGGTTPYINVAGCGLKGCKDESGFKAMFNHPYAACFLQDGSLLVSDTRNHRIRRLAPDPAKVQSNQAATERSRLAVHGGGGGGGVVVNSKDSILFSPAARTSNARRHANRRPSLQQRSRTSNTTNTTTTPSLSAMLLQWSAGERVEQKNHPTHALRSSIVVTTVAGTFLFSFLLRTVWKKNKNLILCLLFLHLL